MKKVPETNQYFVSNASDLVANIQYTKNIDMDEEGYLKLSSPFPKLTSEADIANFSIFIDAINIGISTTDDSSYKFVTSDNIYDIDLDDLSVTLDAAAPLGNDTARFVGWKGGDWYLNTDNDIYSLQSYAGTVWDIENTDAVDYQEVFVNKNTLCAVQGSSNVQQFLTTDMNGTTPPSSNSGVTLVIPNNFTITGMAYSNYRMGIATLNEARGQAFFFTWDGTTAEAGQGIPVSAPIIIDVVAYQNSWAILTSKGQLMRFNGGGFDVLANLPPYYFNANWILGRGSRDHGRIMSVDGDVIYINFGTLMDSSEDDSGILQGFFSGIWCYDDNIKSLYHRHGLSNSKLSREVVTFASNIGTSTAHQLLTGDKVLASDNIIYYAIYLTANTFSLATSYDLAVAGTASTFVSTNTLIWIKREDWSQLTAHATNFGACIKFDGGGNLLTEGVLPFFAGLGLATKAMAYNNTTCIMAPKFDNLGTVCYYKMKAAELEDNYRAIIVKHAKLVDGDRIVIKYKIKDNYKPIAIGEAADTSGDIFITWVNSTSFTTTINLTNVAVGDEVEFFSGAGGGSTAHVVSTTNNAGTWTVVVDEAIRGGASGNKSTCVFDSFKKLETITKDNQNETCQFNAPLGKVSKWIQVKLELRGRGIKVEELIVDNVVHKPLIS